MNAVRGQVALWRLCTALLALLSFGCAAAQSDVRTEGASPYEFPSAAQLRALPAETWSAEVGGLRLRYHLVSLEGFSSLGYFVFAEKTQTCHIYIDSWLAKYASQEEHLAVVFHEVGHCADAAHLGFSHNAFAREGCAYGAYYCVPAEGYAETWRYAYTARCGFDALSIGYDAATKNSADVSLTGALTEPCTLPTAEGVLPPLFAERLAHAR